MQSPETLRPMDKILLLHFMSQIRLLEQDQLSEWGLMVEVAALKEQLSPSFPALLQHTDTL